MNRRDIFKMMGLSPVILPAVVYAQSKEGNEPTEEAIKLVLYGARKKNGEMMHLSSNTLGGGFSIPEPDPSKSVAMSVGNDGEFWVKTNNGQWKRVVTE